MEVEWRCANGKGEIENDKKMVGNERRKWRGGEKERKTVGYELSPIVNDVTERAFSWNP